MNAPTERWRRDEVELSGGNLSPAFGVNFEKSSHATFSLLLLKVSSSDGGGEKGRAVGLTQFVQTIRGCRLICHSFAFKQNLVKARRQKKLWAPDIFGFIFKD